MAIIKGKNTMTKPQKHKGLQRNQRSLVKLALLGVMMLGLTYASVPLYKMFCQLVGIPVPQVAIQGTEAPQTTDGRVIEVRFSAASDPLMAVQLRRGVPSVKTKVGEPTLVAYEATNPTNHNIQGIAIHTVTMYGDVDSLDATDYINLIQCFCFNETTYPAGQTLQLPVSFTIKTTLPQGVNTLVFSYTLYDVGPSGR